MENLTIFALFHREQRGSWAKQDISFNAHLACSIERLSRVRGCFLFFVIEMEPVRFL